MLPITPSQNNFAFSIQTFLLLTLMSFSSASQTVFKDITEDAGIQHQFIVYEGMFGGGACVFDYNKDGFEDLFITGGMSEDRLYLNNGNGTFTNRYNESGLTDGKRYVTQGAISADVNKDGWPDLFITTLTIKDSVKVIPRAENLLFLNNGNSTFKNVTKEYGLSNLLSFSTGACFGDFDIDGYPDIYVGNYFLEYEGTLTAINDNTIVNANQTAKGYLLRNRNGKSFSNEYSDYGLTHRGFGFGGVFTDYDNDHDLDLLVNHDFGYKAVPNVFLRNDYPDEEFVDVAKMLNIDLKINAMGTAVGDYNNDGMLDYFVTNIRFNQFMVNQGTGKPFVNKAKELGMDFVSIGWGANFADFDNDGDLDLFVANGDLNPNDTPLADFYFENQDGHFTERALMVKLNDYGVGRGSVVFDIENDGDLDILVINQKPVHNDLKTSVTKLYRNDSTKGNWIKVALQGIDSDFAGIGSRIEVVTEKHRMIREIDGGSSHLSQNSTIAHFGLGSASKVDSIIVTWIGGKKQLFTNQEINTVLTVMEVSSNNGILSNTWGLFLLIPSIVFGIVFGFYRTFKKNRFKKR